MTLGESGAPAAPRLTIVFPYYENPQMLRFQLEIIASYPSQIRGLFEVIVVDDASPSSPARNVARDTPLNNLRVFRISEDKPWNQDAARNIGAHEARGEFLLLTDIDHVVPESTIETLLEIRDSEKVYTLARKAHFSDKVVPSHVNSYFLAKSLYWSIGGYDEDFWGAYGTDRLFRKRLLGHAGIVELPHARLELVTRGSIEDAKNVTFPRSPSMWRRLRSLSLRALKLLGLRPTPLTFANPYTREL
jgi:glycosyltransferase involved in cell wall biosynthesis